MPAADDEFTAHCLELLSPLGVPRARRLVGGRGRFVAVIVQALVFAERLFLKTDVQTRPAFEAAGCTPFSFETKDGAVSMSYFSAPDDAMESPGLMQPWARLALEAALRARAAKPASARAKTKATPPARIARPRKPPAKT